MTKDVRDSALYEEAESLYRRLLQVGTGRICDAAEVCVSPDGRYVAFTGTLVDVLEGMPQTRICMTELATGDTHILTSGPNNDRLPKFSPDGRQLAFLSDRRRAGDPQLQLLTLLDESVESIECSAGWVECLQWSSDGESLLLGVAGYGADTASGQGAVTSRQQDRQQPDWLPTVEQGGESFRWRRAWIYEHRGRSWRQASGSNDNVWEAVWCGEKGIAAVISPGPQEGLWYSARLHFIDAAPGNGRETYAPRAQLGCLAASPSGRNIAVVEAICSDRGIVAGELRLIDAASGRTQRIDCCGMDVSHVEWRSDRRLLVAGHRGFETLTALYDVESEICLVSWASSELTTAGFHIAVAGLGEDGDCVLVGENFVRAPEIAVIRQGQYRPVTSFSAPDDDSIHQRVDVSCVSWAAADGLEIQGWLLRPKRAGPHPLVMQVHGGPVLQWRPAWLGRWRSVLTLLLIEHGYAVFQPNPRGSTGRGQDFVRHVLGDLGGADTRDYLAGLDHLVNHGVADSRRLGVMGASYGGYMASWLITQDSRFAAAIPVAPVSNRVSAYLLSNIPQFTALFLDDHYANPGGKFFQRSPIMHAHKVKTPTLNICGALDRCTPPAEAAQFHNALLHQGARSALVTYPGEGHGVRSFPAVIDYATRVVAWFEEHMPP